MPDITTLLPVILIALILWLIGLSSLYYRLHSHFNKLAKGVKSGNLIKVLETVVSTEQKNSKNIISLEKSLKNLENLNRLNIQKIGFIRFNPFAGIGGDQSFAVSLLDDTDSGFVLTCLHTRDRTRIYAKPVTKGKSKYELSKEETNALKKASTKK